MGIVRSLGLRGLYRGTPATLMRYTSELVYHPSFYIAILYGFKRPLDLTESILLNNYPFSFLFASNRDVPFSILFFPLNSFLKLQGADEDGKTSFSVILGAGLVAGVVGASAVTPADGRIEFILSLRMWRMIPFF